MSLAYTGLADWFEYLNKDCDYEKWSQYLHERLAEAGAKFGRGLDIGCGSGYFTRYFQRLGCDMTGFDVSAPMLSKAESFGGVCRPQYVLADVRKLKINGRADFAIAVNDCFNYLPPRDLCTAFGRVAAALKKGGIFLFDVSSEYKLRRVIGDNVFCEDCEDVAYMWFNHLFEDRVEMTLEECISRAKVVSDLHEKVGKCEMVRHEFVEGNPQIQKTVFSNGISVQVDFQKQTYEIRNEGMNG